MNKKKYLYRRQFILGRRFVKRLKGWKKTEVSDRLFLTSHPDLQITKVENKNNLLVLIGFILDPYNPSFDNKQIAQDIINTSLSINDLLNSIDTKCGRFSIIARIDGVTRILNDAAGFRQIFYYKKGLGNMWCASQPAILSEVHNLYVDDEIKNDLYQLSLFKKTSEYWFPGRITLYKNIYHLTPNHYLNLNSSDVVRYWPNKNYSPITIHECVEESTKILQGLFKSACNRFDMAFAITAGMDTRVLLAASKNVKEKIYYFTHTHSALDENGPDIKIPKTMLKHFGEEHHIAYHSENIPNEFETIFRRSVTAARTKKLINSYAMYRHFDSIDSEKIVTNGVCSEIVRSFYPFPAFIKLNGKALSTLAAMNGSKIAEKEFDYWLNSTKEIAKSGINLLDLFYWENRNANWCSMSYSEYDIAFESFSPFNCRRLLEIMLRVERESRLPPSNTLHYHLIRKMWPELLEFEINPPLTIKELIQNKVGNMTFYKILRIMRFLFYYLKTQK